MPYLLDTNILLRWASRRDPERPTAIAALRIIWSRQDQVFITAQNLFEFWSVTTRPASANGLGMTPSQARRRIRRIRRMFSLAPETAVVIDEWLQLVTDTAATGRIVYDAKLIAIMLAHGITHMLTFDSHDMGRFQKVRPGISITHPKDV